jgi:hypothetical protein
MSRFAASKTLVTASSLTMVAQLHCCKHYHLTNSLWKTVVRTEIQLKEVCPITRPPMVLLNFFLKPSGRCHVLRKQLLGHLSFVLTKDSGLATSPCCICAAVSLDRLYTYFVPWTNLTTFTKSGIDVVPIEGTSSVILHYFRRDWQQQHDWRSNW